MPTEEALATYEAAPKKKPASTADAGASGRVAPLIQAVSEARKNAEQAPAEEAHQPALTATRGQLQPGRLVRKSPSPVILGVGASSTLGLAEY